jgi:ABC-type sulfate transport system permease subunit
VLATLFVTLPFVVRELVPVLEAAGVDAEQAAATLGASAWQTFWRVTFPALRWGLAYGLVLTFARALGEFGAVLVIGGGVQGQTETTIRARLRGRARAGRALANPGGGRGGPAQTAGSGIVAVYPCLASA